ncbi:MAG: hypothetical protein KGS61_08615 [Verrucomicrobia bacterium]|nr:hypothetical protein [Verrucomicrobiota bacterium]
MNKTVFGKPGAGKGMRCIAEVVDDWNVKGSFAMATGMRKVDAKGLGGCYDTSAGVGIRGGHAADSASRKKGLPWQLIPVAMGGVAVALVFVPKLIGGAVAHQLTTMTTGALKGMTNMAVLPGNAEHGGRRGGRRLGMRSEGRNGPPLMKFEAVRLA